MKINFLTAAMISLLLGACASTNESLPGTSSQADYPVYESVASLVAETDATLEVRVGEVASTEMDNGGDDKDQDPGVPMAFWHATVVTVLEGDSSEQPGDQVVVAWPDLDKDNMQDRSALKTGQVVVLFTKRLTPVDAPGIDTQDVFYVPLGGDNGVLDVVDGRATARSASLTRIAASPTSDTDGDRLTVANDELASAVGDLSRRSS